MKISELNYRRSDSALGSVGLPYPVLENKDTKTEKKHDLLVDCVNYKERGLVEIGELRAIRRNDKQTNE